MQAIIMAAGKGSRLGSLTNDGPKSFVEIKGKRLIEYNLRMLLKYGITDITIVTGYKSEAFECYTASPYHAKLVFNPFFEMVNVLGSFFIGQGQLHGDFIYMHADTLCDFSIFEQLLASNADLTLPVDFKDCDEEAMKVRIEKGRIVEINKTMPLEVAAGEFIGIAKLSKAILSDLRQEVSLLMKEKAFNAYFEAAIQGLVNKAKFEVRPIPTNGSFWTEVDFPEDYERAVAAIPDSLVRL